MVYESENHIACPPGDTILDQIGQQDIDISDISVGCNISIEDARSPLRAK